MLPKGQDRIAAILLKLKGSKGEKPKEDKESDDSESDYKNPGLTSAMEEFIKAVRDDDAEKASAALCNFINIHEDGEGEDESSEEDESL